jgi:hypothetical protein
MTASIPRNPNKASNDQWVSCAVGVLAVDDSLVVGYRYRLLERIVPYIGAIVSLGQLPRYVQ